MLNESEICFEAADFMRAGKDIFVRQSHVCITGVLCGVRVCVGIFSVSLTS